MPTGSYIRQPRMGNFSRTFHIRPAILSDLQSGMSYGDIANKYGVSRSTVQWIKKGHWRIGEIVNMRFRILIQVPGEEKNIQKFDSTKQGALNLAKTLLLGKPVGTRCSVYETVEELVAEQTIEEERV